MSLRWRVSLFIVLALFIALVVQFVLSFFLFRRALSNDLATDLGQFSYLIEQNLLDTPQGLTLSQEGLAAIAPYSSYANGRGRVLDAAGRPILLIGGLFPEETSGWLIHHSKLSDGHRLETAMSYQLHNTALRDYLRVSSLGLPLLILFFGAGGLWLSLQLLRPLQKLQTTVEKVTTSGNLKARVEVPERNDELSRLAQSYNRMMAKLEEFFERERIFTRYASHELRNPLAALRVQVDAALGGDLPSEQVLPVLKKEVQRLGTILDSLLILSRDELHLDTNLDLAVVAKESLTRACAFVESKPLSLEYQGPQSVPFKGDKALLGRMLDNLLENASKYSRAGHITLKVSQLSDSIKVSVSDQGPGVPAEMVAKLTTPFFRVKGQQGSGVGLGLSVVQHIVKAHSGRLTFENLEPTGFAVTITFPRGGV
jgi:signal transduction histidine kinase